MEQAPLVAPTTPPCRLTRLASWNLWLIPNSSHELGPRPLKQADRLAALLRSPEGLPAQPAGLPEGLEVVCMQEVWAWHAGIFKLCFACTAWMPLSLRPALRLVSTKFDTLFDIFGFLFLLLALLTGVVLRLLWFLPGYETLMCWNPRRLLIPSLFRAGLTHPIGASPCFTEPALLDSGLFMVANRKPKERYVLDAVCVVYTCRRLIDLSL